MRSKTLVFTLSFLLLASVFTYAASDNDFFENGLQGLYYYSIRIDDHFPSLKPLQASIREFEQAIQQGFMVDESRLLLGMIFQTIGEHERAVSQFTRLTDRLGSRETWIQVLLGDSYQSLGQVELATESYQLALVGDSYAKAHNGLGQLAFTQGDYEKACEEFELAIEVAEGYLEARVNLGKSQFHLGDYPKAQETLEMANQMNANVVDVHYYLGLVYTKQGLEDQAIHAFERVLQLDPKHALAQAQLDA